MGCLFHPKQVIYRCNESYRALWILNHTVVQNSYAFIKLPSILITKTSKIWFFDQTKLERFDFSVNPRARVISFQPPRRLCIILFTVQSLSDVAVWFTAVQINKPLRASGIGLHAPAEAIIERFVNEISPVHQPSIVWLWIVFTLAGLLRQACRSSLPSFNIPSEQCFLFLRVHLIFFQVRWLR